MADPKTVAASAKDQPSGATDQQASPIFLAIGRLRRDLLIVAQGTAEAVIEQSKSAVLEGRAAEVFVIEAKGYFSESEVRWDADQIDQPRAKTEPAPDSGPLLNSHPSAAKAVAKARAGESQLKPTTVQAERAKAEEASKTTADLVDGAEAQTKANQD